MAAAEVKCPKCGAELRVDDVILKVECTSCKHVWPVTRGMAKTIELQKGMGR